MTFEDDFVENYPEIARIFPKEWLTEGSTTISPKIVSEYCISKKRIREAIMNLPWTVGPDGEAVININLILKELRL